MYASFLVMHTCVCDRLSFRLGPGVLVVPDTYWLPFFSGPSEKRGPIFMCAAFARTPCAPSPWVSLKRCSGVAEEDMERDYSSRSWPPRPAKIERWSEGIKCACIPVVFFFKFYMR